MDNAHSAEQQAVYIAQFHTVCTTMAKLALDKSFLVPTQQLIQYAWNNREDRSQVFKSLMDYYDAVSTWDFSDATLN